MGFVPHSPDFAHEPHAVLVSGVLQAAGALAAGDSDATGDLRPSLPAAISSDAAGDSRLSLLSTRLAAAVGCGVDRSTPSFEPPCIRLVKTRNTVVPQSEASSPRSTMPSRRFIVRHGFSA